MNFSNTLRQLLQDRNWRQADLCRITGIQTSLISDYLRGKKSPTIGNAILIADALNVSLDELVGKEESAHEKDEILQEICTAAAELSEEGRRLLLDIARTMASYLH